MAKAGIEPGSSVTSCEGGLIDQARGPMRKPEGNSNFPQVF